MMERIRLSGQTDAEMFGAAVVLLWQNSDFPGPDDAGGGYQITFHHQGDPGKIPYIPGEFSEDLTRILAGPWLVDNLVTKMRIYTLDGQRDDEYVPPVVGEYFANYRT